MRLSWNEVKGRAAKFAQEWKDASYERGESQTFYNEFFEVFGVQRKKVATFEEPVRKLGDRQGFIDLFWKGTLLVEHKSKGKDLKRAKEEALEYFPNLKDYELPRYILVSDFQRFELHDLEEDKIVRFRLSQLADFIQHFGFVLGVQKRTFRDQDPVNIQASELMGKLHDALEQSGYSGHNLERYLVRLLFCLFADDTGIFEQRDVFADLIRERTKSDGSDTGQWISHLFQVLNTPLDKREKNLDLDLAKFPFVNGELFAETLPIPSFNSAMHSLLLEVHDFNWEAISPAIFGSLFQSVMDPKERRQQGAHYTTERNILKVIEPLFLDELRAELTSITARQEPTRTKALNEFLQKLSALKFLDPACGCGNFLIIAYRELRQLEIEVLKVLQKNLELSVQWVSKIDVDQFYGIELDEFPARIAETAMWMMDHIMNNRLSLEFGTSFVRIPLRKSPHIVNADALEIDWSTVISPEECTYILGNPPFGGAKKQIDRQRMQVRRVASLGGTGGTLDYVAAWFIKAGEFLRKSRAKIGFVATNSITQGEQVAQLWPILFGKYGLEISYAHRTFAWGSDARGMAHVHVVIIGLTRRDMEQANKRLFSYSNINDDPTESSHKALTPYLFDAGNVIDSHLVIRKEAKCLSDAPEIAYGTQPIDGGFLILDDESRSELIKSDPLSELFLRPFVGSVEYLHSIPRWILLLKDASPSQIRKMPRVLSRIQKVKEFRLASKRQGTVELAAEPTKFHFTTIPVNSFLVIPEVSSERREYVPIGWLEPPVIPSNLVRVIMDAELWHFGILTSAMHMSWLRYIGGRLKSDYRYSIGIVYNPFPWPQAKDRQKSEIRSLAKSVLDTRASFPAETLADLYDVDAMPPKLKKAHRALDAAVDALYKPSGFDSDRERVEHLFGLYEKLVSPLTAAVAKADRKQRRTRKRT